jgi:gliding motility-associated-like protein
MRRTLILGLSVVLTALAAAASPAAPPNALEATVEPFFTRGVDRSYPARDEAGASIAPAAWKVVPGTGNCCENYLAATSTGRLMDFGGGTIRYTDDTGSSWSEVSSLDTLGAEGAVVEAPGGDIVGVTWDPYTGDRLEAFKFEAASGKWFYAPNSLHQPFFDRPYIAVVPGPFQVGGTTVPYLTYMKGGWPEQTTYMSIDGLNYVPTLAPSDALGTPKSDYLAVTADASADWLQPLTVPGIAPLAGGGALAWEPAGGDQISLSILEPPSTTWSPFAFPNAPVLKGRMLSDSAGGLHNVNVTTRAVGYQMTTDGGRTWGRATAALPSGYEAIAPMFDRFWDFKVNASLDMAVVSLYARNSATNRDQNLVLIFSTASKEPRLVRTLFAGKGDKTYGTGLGSVDRLDFITVAILPSGRVATTFMDTEWSAPVLGITSSAQSGSTVEEPIPSPSPSATLNPTATPSPGEPADSTSPGITAVSDRPDPITPNGDGRRDRATIRFVISETADVTVSILDRRGRLVRTVHEKARLSPGGHKTSWTGRNTAGRRVRAGTYFYEIIAEDAAGNRGQTTEGSITVRRAGKT